MTIALAALTVVAIALALVDAANAYTRSGRSAAMAKREPGLRRYLDDPRRWLHLDAMREDLRTLTDHASRHSARFSPLLRQPAGER